MAPGVPQTGEDDAQHHPQPRRDGATPPEPLMDDPPPPTTDGRGESPNQRMDRNWNELLQELRVTQTGVQILTGFLLTVPFQQRFTELDAYQRGIYLTLVVLALVSTGLIVAPVSLHRVLFRRRLKRELVTEGDLLARAGLATLAVVLSGAAMLLFDVVAGRGAGVSAGVAVLGFLTVLWLVVPLRLARRAHAEPPPHPQVDHER